MDILETLKRLVTPPTQEEILAKSRDPRGYMNLPQAAGRRVAALPPPPAQFNMTAPDVAGTADMNTFLSQGIARNADQAAKDRAIMASLPDLTGTTDTPVAGVNPLMINPNNPELGMLIKPRDITATPFPTPVVEDRFKETEEERTAATEPIEEAAPITKKGVAKPKTAQPVEAKPAQVAEAGPKEPTLDDILDKAQQEPEADQDMLAAQKARRENQQLLAIMRGSQQFGAGLSSANYDKDHLKQLEGMADAPVADLKEVRQSQREKQKDIMDRTKFALDTERGKQDFQKVKLDMQKASMELTDATKRADPKSDASLLAQASTLDALKRMGRKDLAAMLEKKPLSAAELEKTFGNMSLSNMVSAYEAQQNRLLISQQNAETKKLATAEKMDNTNVKRLDQVSKLIDADMQRINTPIGKAANLANTAERLEALVRDVSPENVTNQQMYELARGLDAMLTPGAGSISGTKHLLPVGWRTHWANLAEFAGNKPVGAGQAAYVKQIMKTIGREKEISRAQISRAVHGAVGSYLDLSKTKEGKPSEAWNSMLQMKGIDPEMVNPQKEFHRDLSTYSAPAAPAPKGLKEEVAGMTDEQLQAEAKRLGIK